MNNSNLTRLSLPEGYFYPDAREAAHLHAELLRELPSNHPLFGVPLETFAARDGTTTRFFDFAAIRSVLCWCI